MNNNIIVDPLFDFIFYANVYSIKIQLDRIKRLDYNPVIKFKMSGVSLLLL